MNLCWTCVVHLLGSESCVSGTGGSSRASSAPLRDIGDARRRGGARQIHRADASMRDRAAHEHRVQHVRQLEIGDELPAAGQQPLILAAQDGAADEGRLLGSFMCEMSLRPDYGLY